MTSTRRARISAMPSSFRFLTICLTSCGAGRWALFRSFNLTTPPFVLELNVTHLSDRERFGGDMTKAVLRKSVVAALFAMVGALNACSYWHGDLERIVDQS